ncbi:MAG: nuclear transport factor 2 family protein [Mucilaginibacter polytrichastri]|nr:nuclear transport factor 2 family protein [Mucilaginibacter polytrichastri]
MTKRAYLLIIAICMICSYSQAQTKEAAAIDSLNSRLDRAVVKKDSVFMARHYADDFFFLHATGMIDSKKTWIKSALKTDTQYASRLHDSVKVEMHPGMAVVSGLLTVRPLPESKKPYRLRYIRVYALRKNIWQLVSHHSTAEVAIN